MFARKFYAQKFTETSPEVKQEAEPVATVPAKKIYTPEEKKKLNEKFKDAVKIAMYVNNWLKVPSSKAAKESAANSEMKTGYSHNVSVDGLYKITLRSVSVIGAFDSEGKAIIARLPNGDYEIKAFFDPNVPNPAPCYAITMPYFIHAIAQAKEDGSNVTFLCSGKVYVQKRVMFMVTKIVEGDDIEVKFGEPLGGDKNTYAFSQSPIVLFGVNPGKMTNTGNIEKISSDTHDAEFERAWNEKQLDEALKLPGLVR